MAGTSRGRPRSFTHPPRKDKEFNGDPQGATVLAKGDIADVMKVR
jgi:hypothetical protein